MLEELSKHDQFFRRVALSICKDKTLADDLVQEMYVNMYYSDSSILNPKYYAVQTIKNLFIKECKRKRCISIEEMVLDIKDDSSIFSIDDTEAEILEKANKLSYLQHNLLKESFDKSLRQIQKEFNIGYQTANRELKKARIKTLGKDYNTKYKNKRRKNG